MSRSVKVVLYGGSLFIEGMVACLSATPGLEIQRVEVKDGKDLERVHAVLPDIIIVELGIASSNLTFTLLQKFPGVTLIGLDPDSDRLLVLSVREQTALAADDLVKVIMAHQQPERDEA